MTLLNLTHHPATEWAPRQRDAAQALAPPGDVAHIVDQPFPRVDPAATTEQVDRLADDIATDLAARYAPAATVVHLQGEMTLTVALVARLQGLGFRVVASTTERVATVHGDGNRTLSFAFHGFRDYAPLYSAINA